MSERMVPNTGAVKRNKHSLGNVQIKLGDRMVAKLVGSVAHPVPFTVRTGVRVRAHHDERFGIIFQLSNLLDLDTVLRLYPVKV